jgi:hypothetical protein
MSTMSNQVAILNQQIVSEIDSLADFWRSAAAATADVAPPAQPAKRKRGRRHRSKTPPPIANP